MIKLNITSCRWALKHLKNEGDTDLFPRPFEIDALTQSSGDVIRLLRSIDIGSYRWVGGRRTLVPKEMVSFRVATQLDPIDSLVLAALIRQFGFDIERKRVPIEEEIVFSYRFKPSRGGHLYTPTSNWSKFWQASLERTEAQRGWVVIADVGGYYNQIYHHSMENQLLAMGLPQEVVTSILRLLKKLTQGVSRGIPIGPHSVHLLAECVFDPIDRSLLSRKYTFCRFVDDVHIFCNTQEQAFTALFDLANILDKQQRLALQRHKTKVLPAEEFAEIATRMTMEAPLNELEREIIEVIDRLSGGDRYKNVQPASLSNEDLDTLSQRNLENLLNSYLGQEEPNYPRIRWLFRRLAQVGVPGAVSLALDRIEELVPALADLGQYLISVQQGLESNWVDIGNDILKAIYLPIIEHSEYLTMTLLNLYARLPALNHVEPILQMYPTSPPMVRRKVVRAATALGADYWLREQKETLPVVDPWLRRALIAGASTFSEDERKYWLQHIQKEGTELEKIVARWARRQ
jgi:hypothetical protein